MRAPHPVQAVDDVDIEIEKEWPPGITVERMFDETLGRLTVDAEGGRRCLGFRVFLHSGDPAEVRGFQCEFNGRFVGVWAPRLQQRLCTRARTSGAYSGSG